MTERNREDLAAGLALGTLDADERAEAERLARMDADFAAEVDAWQMRLAPLAEAVPPLTPPTDLWQRIEQGLPAKTEPVTAPMASRRSELELLRRKLSFWRYSAISGLAAALLLAVLWFAGTVWPGTDTDRYVALLNGQKGEPGFLVTIDAANAKLLLHSLGAAAPKAKAYELWLMKDDGSVPLTLGMIKPGQYVTLHMTEEMPAADWDRGPKLAVSLEPPEGAPSGRSMGPIVYAGNVIRQTPSDP